MSVAVDGTGSGYNWTPGRKRLRDLPALARWAIRLVREAAPRYLTVTVVLDVVLGVVVASQLLALARLLDRLGSVRTGGSVRQVALPLVAFLAFLLVGSILTLVRAEIARYLSNLVARHATLMVARAAAAADLLDFEQPAFHDRLQRVLANATYRPIEMTGALTSIGTALLTSAGAAVALVFLQPVLLVIVLVAVAPVWLATRQLTRDSVELDVEMTENDRRRFYYLELLTGRSHAAEVRALGLVPFFERRHDELWRFRLRRLRDLGRRRVVIGAVARVANVALLGAVAVYLVVLVSNGDMSTSDAVVAAGALVLLADRFNTLVSGAGLLYTATLFLDDVEAFLRTAAARSEASDTDQAVHEPFASVELDHVSFRYPSGATDALTDVTLTLRRGEVIALVGPNGSGKTTLAKLLAQLYPVDRGAVRWNGTDVRGLDRRSLRSDVAVIFQDFERYELTAAENIGLGRVERLDDRPGIERAAQRAGADGFIRALRQGYDQLLGPKWWGGRDLSGGQWQRVALARAYFRDAGLVILDEPAASLDVESEAALFATLKELCAGRAVVMISHRFSTVTGADRIYVLDDGRIVEQGTHAELLRAGGRYAAMFRLQASQYLDPSGQGEDERTRSR